MLKIRLPFGFKTISLDQMYTMYSGKIRIKLSLVSAMTMFTDLHDNGVCIRETSKGCVIISYFTTDFAIHCNNFHSINRILATIMHERVNTKYAHSLSYSGDINF